MDPLVVAAIAFAAVRGRREGLAAALLELGASVEEVSTFLILMPGLEAKTRARWEERDFTIRVWAKRWPDSTNGFELPTLISLEVSTPVSGPLSLRLRRADAGWPSLFAVPGRAWLGLGPTLPALDWTGGGLKAYGGPEALPALSKLAPEHAAELGPRFAWARVEEGTLTVCAGTPGNGWPDAAELGRLLRFCSSWAQVL